MQSSDLKKDEDFMLKAGVAYHALCKSTDLLDEINIRPWENKKTIKAKSPSNIFRAASISDIFDQVYTGEINNWLLVSSLFKKIFSADDIKIYKN